jgi:lipoprotein NlpI
MIAPLRALVGAAIVLLPAIGLLPGEGRAQGAAPGNVQFHEVQIAADAFSLGEPVPAWVIPSAIPDPAQAEPMLIRLADTQYYVDRAPIVYVRRAMTINDATSLSRAGQVSIPFVPQYHKLKVHAVRVLRGGETLDRTASSSVRFLQRETGLEQGIYSGEVTASILVNDLRVGDTLEFSYSLYGQNPVFGDKFIATASWDQGYPAALRRVVLTHPAGRQIAWRLIGDRKDAPLTPAESVHEGMRRLVFEERSIAKILVEPMTPMEHVAFRRLQFSEFNGWSDVGRWANDLFQPNDNLGEDGRAVVDTLRTKATEEDRVVAALEFVQSQIRYFSVSMGESSHRPTQPEVVLKRRYGDCKDKSLLLVALLQALNIPAKPVLVDLGRLRGLDSELPSPALFNHAIVQATVGGQVFYLDPTALGQHGRLRRMGQIHEGAQVLVVTPQARELSIVASPDVKELVRSVVSETATIHKFNADGELKTKQIWHGVVAERLRVMQERMPREQLLKTIADAMESRYPGAKLVGEPDIQDDRVNNALSIAATYAVPKLASERDGNWFVRFLPTNMRGTLVAPPSAARAVPLKLQHFPYEASYTFEVKFPDEVSVISDPRAQSVHNKHFSYTVASSFRGNLAKHSVELRMLAGKVEVADLQKYAEDARAAVNLSSGAIVVPKRAIKAVASAKAAKKDFAQTVRDRVQETVDKTSEAIKSGKLAGADLASSHCLRSAAHSDLGHSDKAIADANEALKLAPNAPAMLSCRAYAYFVAGEFEKSVADYAKAIALGDTDAKALQQRGISKFYAGRLEDAAQDFARAAEDTSDRERQVYSDLWLAWTHLRLGKPLPEALLKRAGEESTGGWPRPARAVLAGKLSPEEMLKLLDRKTGDERRMAASEGYFYLGQYYLGRGDKAKAREYFEKTRQLNIILYTEHTAAGFELRQLEASDRAPPATTSSIAKSAPDSPEAQVQNAGATPPPAAKKAGGKPAPKKSESWARDLWKQ